MHVQFFDPAPQAIRWNPHTLPDPNGRNDTGGYQRVRFAFSHSGHVAHVGRL
jgi:hypothetical protein